MTKNYFGVSDIRERYGVGRDRALAIIREVKRLCGDSLGKGKVLPAELEAWERKAKEL